ncbi:sodium:calcium antiporter [bacterium]|nr:sodium:calcium antiporter [bacterium]
MALLLVICEIILTIAVILFAAELFTNAIEWVGRRYELSQGMVGSVLAAVGTALPETLVAIVAIVLGTTGEISGGHAIGTGAILGAPFMLATLAFLMTGLAFYASRALKWRTAPFSVDMNVAGKDLTYFFWAYLLAIGLGLIRHYSPAHDSTMRYVDWTFAALLILIYIVYVKLLANTGETMSHWKISRLHFQPNAEKSPLRRFIFLQLLVALALMFVGSQFFVKEVQHLADMFHWPPLILALLLVPVATELPEKFNSVLWVSRGRDTLAMGNISGAMVLQATFPVSIGLLFTEWSFPLVSFETVSAGLALLSALVLVIGWKRTGRLHPALLLTGGALYLAYILFVVLYSHAPHG